jgi:hypothetical protein
MMLSHRDLLDDLRDLLLLLVSRLMLEHLLGLKSLGFGRECALLWGWWSLVHGLIESTRLLLSRLLLLREEVQLLVLLIGVCVAHLSEKNLLFI